MKETTDPQPHGENFLSVYELYRQLITPEQARHVDRLLREMSTYDENSYPYVHGLLTTLQFRVMANTPMAAAEAIWVVINRVLLDEMSCRATGPVAAGRNGNGARCPTARKQHPVEHYRYLLNFKTV